MEAIQDSISFFIHSHSYILIHSSIETCDALTFFLFFFFLAPLRPRRLSSFAAPTEFKQAAVQKKKKFSFLSSPVYLLVQQNLSHPQSSSKSFSFSFFSVFISFSTLLLKPLSFFPLSPLRETLRISLGLRGKRRRRRERERLWEREREHGKMVERWTPKI